MRASTAFFAGIGTVGVAIAGGLGGGLWIANMMNSHASRYGLEAATLDPQALPASAPLPYVGAALAFMMPGVDGRPPARERRADSVDAAPLALPSAEAKVSTDQPAKPAGAAAAKQPSQDTQPSARAPAKPASQPEDAYAKARDSDLKRQADRGRAERAQRWASRHQREHDQQSQQDQQNQDNSDQQASEAANSNSGNNAVGRYSERHYSYRRHRDGRPRYRNAERWYRDDREQRYYTEDPPPFDAPQVGVFGTDD